MIFVEDDDKIDGNDNKKLISTEKIHEILNSHGTTKKSIFNWASPKPLAIENWEFKNVYVVKYSSHHPLLLLFRTTHVN